jgi:hypothetical protein
MGKSAIVFVVGMSVLLGYALMNISTTSTTSTDNYTAYYGRSMAHNIAITGANIGTQLLLSNPAYNSDLIDQNYAGGKFDMHIVKPGGDSSWVQVFSSIDVSGTTIRDTVIACLKFTSFSKYGWFTEAEQNGYHGSPFFGDNDWKITGDSVFGPAHTNWKFNLAGAPYFHDKVTATNAATVMPIHGLQAPVFRSGYQWGITVPRRAASMDLMVANAASGGAMFNGVDVGLTFQDDQVAVKIPPGTGALRNDTVAISTLAPNGIIAVMNGDLRIKGRYEGKVSVVAHNDAAATNKGNVWLDGNGIVASDNPMGNSASQDMLGIVANNNVYITQDLSRTSSSVFNIQATVYCQNGELTAQNFWSIPISGRVLLYGGVSQKTAGSLGVFNPGHGLMNGMLYTIRYDDRFNTQSPPAYPVAYKYELVSWWEN